MKNIVPFLFLFFFGCSDDDLKSNEIDHEIIGKWQLDATKISPGGIVDWTLVENGQIYDFRADGTFDLSKWEGCKSMVSGTFAVSEERLYLKFSCSTEVNEPIYLISFDKNKLILGFVGCIEECSYRFKRLN